jgi:prepilin-type N-terminal cleavage/methylation domain-containing protein
MMKQNGFTLLETVIVIVILIIVAAVATPEFRRLAINGHLKAAAKDIVSDIVRTRVKALSENNPNFSMVFDQTNNNYTVPTLQSVNLETKSPAYFASDINISSITFDGGSTLTFQTRGTIFPASPASKILTLINSRGSTATITITTTGRVYVQYSLQ